MLRKCICMIVTVALVVCVSVAPVGAVDLDASISVTLKHYPNGIDDEVFQIPRVGDKSVVWPLSVSSVVTSNSTTPYLVYFHLPEVVVNLTSTPSGSVGFYFSWAVGIDTPVDRWRNQGAWNYIYSTANTTSFTYPVEVSSFNFSSSDFIHLSEGLQFSCRIDDVDALTSFSLSAVDYYTSGWLSALSSAPSSDDRCGYFIPSVSLVYSESSADLDALESVADQIAEGNDIARAMYGDIMNALNALKDDTSLMASYINDCLIYLNSIETATIGTYNLCAAYLYNLADIAQTADDIEAELEAFHSDFMSKLDLLIGTITSESDDIQATMNSIYQQLIAWLESNFAEAINPELDSTNDDLSQGIANSEAIEQEWTGSLSDNWSAMHIDDFSFDSSFTSGFMWVSAWVTNIYNALGLYGSIIILPLIIGICKLLLGYFRFSGHGHSSGGDDVDA